MTITRNTIARLGAILVVGAHPDDETFCAGALLAAAAQNGQKVVCITATHGERGVQDAGRWPKSQLASIREQELAAALAELGVMHHEWLDYRDGECANSNGEPATKRIAGLINEHQIDSILTFGPDGLTGHPDHQTMSRWVSESTTRAQRAVRVYYVAQDRQIYDTYLRPVDDSLNIFFAISQPPFVRVDECAIHFVGDEQSVRRKYRAFELMPSQMERLLAEFPTFNDFRDAFGTECFVEATADRRRDR